MIVCICNDVSELTIKKLIKKHSVKSVEELQKYISVSNRCHGCQRYIEKLIEKHYERRNKKKAR